ncbi:MAG TPA: TIGR02206 family membrane protein [Pseudonocardiaceae bacterium]|nr:TIGR02206 family membrane protein [Pseudonocardiaceae bacterium]
MSTILSPGPGIRLTAMGPLPEARQFAAFGWSHAVAVAVFAVVAVALAAAGRRWRGGAGERGLSRGLAIGFAVFLVVMEGYPLLPWRFGIRYSLPLQLCDLAAIAAVWALWSYSPVAFVLTYFWGLTLTSQGFISPELNGPDFPSWEFLSFFGIHSLVVWAAIYLTWGVGLRPSWRGYRIAVTVTIGWGVVMLGFNRLADTNYGFLNAKPLAASLLDLLGPWPWYLLAELVLGSSAWALITWPWVRRGISARTGVSA